MAVWLSDIPLLLPSAAGESRLERRGKRAALPPNWRGLMDAANLQPRSVKVVR